MENDVRFFIWHGETIKRWAKKTTFSKWFLHRFIGFYSIRLLCLRCYRFCYRWQRERHKIEWNKYGDLFPCLPPENREIYAQISVWVPPNNAEKNSAKFSTASPLTFLNAGTRVNLSVFVKAGETPRLLLSDLRVFRYAKGSQGVGHVWSQWLPRRKTRRWLSSYFFALRPH